MKNGVDYWCFSVIGKPLSKKRARIVGWGRHYTPDSWYEHMVRDAFLRAYPNQKPVGIEFFNVSKRKKKKKDEYVNVYKPKKGVKDKDLPTIRVYMFFYFNGGKIGDDDNYVKAVLDALNKVAYVDDRQVKVPTPYVIVDENETERVDVLIVSYRQEEDKHLCKVKRFVDKNARVIDIVDEYEVERLREKTVDELVDTLCQECPDFYECVVRYKDDVIFCENRRR